MAKKKYKYHFTYQTTNLVNGKFYIGIHSTNKIEDGYFGSGVYLTKAIKKYGKQNFKREILSFFDTIEELIEEEKFLITAEFVKQDSNYNLGLGGKGGSIQSEQGRKTLSEKMLGEKNHRFGTKASPETIKKLKQRVPWNKGKSGIYSEETLKKMSESKINLHNLAKNEKI